jgi:hypothetical protein
LDLIAQSNLYQRGIEDWEQKPLADQTWVDRRRFIQEAYQLGTPKVTALPALQQKKIMTMTQWTQSQEQSICTW